MPHSPQHLDRLRLRHLRLLELIDRLGSLRAVGNELSLTQPAVSQMVKDLEFAFGAALIDRSVRGVALTPTGQLALQRARSGLAAFETLAAELDEGQPLVLHVGTNPAMMSGIMPEAMNLAAEGAEAPRYLLRSGLARDMTRALWDGELNCYIGRVDWEVIPHDMHYSLRHAPLFTTSLVVVCSEDHPLAARGTLEPKDLEGWSWALSPEDSNNRIGLAAALRNNGLPEPRIGVEIAADPNALMALAREMGMLTVLAQMALDTRPAEGLVALDLPFLHLPPIEIGFLTLVEHEHLPALVALREGLITAARRSFGAGVEAVPDKG